jgi:hypothetical protein
MNKEKKARLEAHGWRVGSAEEFLGLTPEEAAYIELRIKLSDAVRRAGSSTRRPLLRRPRPQMGSRCPLRCSTYFMRFQRCPQRKEGGPVPSSPSSSFTPLLEHQQRLAPSEVAET